MKKSTRAIVITIIAIMVMAIAAVSANASSSKVTSVDIKKASTTLNVGKSEGLALSYAYAGEAPDTDDITWTSSNPSVATVSNGTVKAKKAGTATITVDFDGEEDTCTVTVKGSASKWINTNGAYTELNKYRKAKHQKALKKSAKLEKIAKARAEEMAKSGKFSHTRPNGKSSLTMITSKSAGHKISAKGENIAMGQKTCKEVSKAWYNSTGHRANMLRKNFKYVGIACYEYNGVTYWAQIFSN